MQGNSLQHHWSASNSGYSKTFLELENFWRGGDLICRVLFTLAKKWMEHRIMKQPRSSCHQTKITLGSSNFLDRTNWIPAGTSECAPSEKWWCLLSCVGKGWCSQGLAQQALKSMQMVWTWLVLLPDWFLFLTISDESHRYLCWFNRPSWNNPRVMNIVYILQSVNVVCISCRA